MQDRVNSLDVELRRNEDLMQLYREENERLRADSRTCRWENYDLRQENQLLESTLRRLKTGMVSPRTTVSSLLFR